MTWARFETSDINDPSLFGETGLGGAGMPLLLVLGYSSGVQVIVVIMTMIMMLMTIIMIGVAHPCQWRGKTCHVQVPWSGE